MTFEEQALPGVWVITPDVYPDPRGWFRETYRESRFREHGIEAPFIQDNHSRSECNVLRGLHYQLRQPQAKLCRVVSGEVLDVAVDIRVGSPTFGQSQTVRLSADNAKQVFIPAGFAHGFRVLSETVDFLYKCTDYYHGDDNYGIAWNDPDLAIDWGVEAPILSDKDAALPLLRDMPREHLPAYDPSS